MEMEDLIYPKQIVIETTDRCNLNCPGCYRDFYVPTTSLMGEETYLGILKEISTYPKKPKIALFARGEVTMDPELKHRLEAAQDFGFGGKICLATNGVLFDRELWEWILKTEICYEIIYSIDGLMQATIKGTRGDLGIQAHGNLKKLLELRDAHKSSTTIGTSLRRVGQDFGEIQRYIAYWLALGCDMVIIRHDLLQEARSYTSGADPCFYHGDRYMVFDVKGEIRLCERRPGPTSTGRKPEETYRQAWRRNIEEHKGTDFCLKCPQRFNGDGFYGEIRFRDWMVWDKTVFFRKDYFNEIYSRTDNRDGVAWQGLR